MLMFTILQYYIVYIVFRVVFTCAVTKIVTLIAAAYLLCVSVVMYIHCPYLLAPPGP
jgi:hypothetical protein